MVRIHPGFDRPFREIREDIVRQLDVAAVAVQFERLRERTEF